MATSSTFGNSMDEEGRQWRNREIRRICFVLLSKARPRPGEWSGRFNSLHRLGRYIRIIMPDFNDLSCQHCGTHDARGNDLLTTVQRMARICDQMIFFSISLMICYMINCCLYNACNTALPLRQKWAFLHLVYLTTWVTLRDPFHHFTLSVHAKHCNSSKVTTSHIWPTKSAFLMSMLRKCHALRLHPPAHAAAHRDLSAWGWTTDHEPFKVGLLAKTYTAAAVVSNRLG